MQPYTSSNCNYDRRIQRLNWNIGAYGIRNYTINNGNLEGITFGKLQLLHGVVITNRFR